jgi:hypothetical protein
MRRQLIHAAVIGALGAGLLLSAGAVPGWGASTAACPSGSLGCDPGPPEPPPPRCKPGKPCTYTCPAGKYVNCMPTRVCSRDYLNWIAENCPGVVVVW